MVEWLNITIVCCGKVVKYKNRVPVVERDNIKLCTGGRLGQLNIYTNVVSCRKTIIVPELHHKRSQTITRIAVLFFGNSFIVSKGIFVFIIFFQPTIFLFFLNTYFCLLYCLCPLILKFALGVHVNY